VTPADDRRTVDQLIRDSDLAAGAILQNPEQMAAPAMQRSWAEVVECAAALWQALPDTPGPVEPRSVAMGDHRDAAMNRLAAMAAAWHRGLIRGNWPGAAGPGDGRLLGIAENLSLAEAKLCGPEPPRPLPRQARADSSVAKARLMHTLYVGAHGITVALQLHERDLLAALSGKHRLPFGESLEQTRQTQHRIAAFEQLAGSCVARTYPDDSRALFREPIGDGRLAQALARWDVQAHRTLASSTSTADLMVINQTERAIGAWSHLILRAAATTGAVDGDQQRERLSPAMERVEAAWAGMADLWRDLTHRTQRCVAAELHHSASEVRDALQEIVHNGMTVATPEVMAARTDLCAAAQTLQQSLSTSVNLACLIRDTLATAPVVGDARGIAAIVARSPQAQGFSVEEDMAAAWAVSPWAAATNALIPVPPPVQEALAVAADQVLDATSAAMKAGAFLDRTPPAAPVGHSPAMGWERGSPMPHLDFGPSGPGFHR
jgi:hypothetical protein